MHELDFQRPVLQRIPQMAQHPERSWRDLLFVANEYHAFATVGETDPTGDERAFALSRQGPAHADRGDAKPEFAAILAWR
jgi:hypothetical protein